MRRVTCDLNIVARKPRSGKSNKVTLPKRPLEIKSNLASTWTVKAISINGGMTSPPPHRRLVPICAMITYEHGLAAMAPTYPLMMAP